MVAGDGQEQVESALGLSPEPGGPDLLSTPAAGPAAVRGGALRVGGYLTGLIAATASAALLVRHLGTILTGRYGVAMTLVAIVASLSDLGLTAVGVREMAASTSADKATIARDLLGLRIVITTLGVIVVTVVAALAYPSPVAAGVLLAGVGLLLQTVQDNFFMTLTVRLRLGWLAALELSRQVLTAVAIAVLVLAGAGLVPFLAVSIPVGLVALAATLPLVRGERALSPTFHWARWRAMIVAILPYSAAIAAASLYFRASTLVLSALSGPHQLSYFFTSFRVIEALTVVPGLLIGAAFPIFARAAREDHDRLGYALGRVFEVSLLIGAWVAVSIAVAAPLAIEVIGGPSFASAAPVLALEGIALGTMFVSLVWSNAMLSLGLYRQILGVNVFMLVLNVALVSALTPADGARGAALGTAIAEGVSMLLQLYLVVRGRPQLRPSPRVPLRVAVAAALGLAPLALTGLPVIARLAISCLLYGAAVLALRAVPPEARDLLPWRRASSG